MYSDNEHVLYGGQMSDSFENAKSFGEFCYNRQCAMCRKYLKVNYLRVDGITSQEITASQ